MSSGPREKIEDPQALAEARAKGLFHAQPLSTRSLVVAAGPATNFVFSIAAFALIALIVGRDATDYTALPARVATVAESSAAATAGLQQGDIIRAANGQTIANFADLQTIVAAAPEQTLALQVERDGQTLALNATPARNGGRGMLGVSGPLVLESEREIVRYGPLSALAAGAANTWEIVARTGV
jgi:regulator of sigma E protease